MGHLEPTPHEWGGPWINFWLRWLCRWLGWVMLRRVHKAAPGCRKAQIPKQHVKTGSLWQLRADATSPHGSAGQTARGTYFDAASSSYLHRSSSSSVWVAFSAEHQGKVKATCSECWALTGEDPPGTNLLEDASGCPEQAALFPACCRCPRSGPRKEHFTHFLLPLFLCKWRQKNHGESQPCRHREPEPTGAVPAWPAAWGQSWEGPVCSKELAAAQHPSGGAWHLAGMQDLALSPGKDQVWGGERDEELLHPGAGLIQTFVTWAPLPMDCPWMPHSLWQARPTEPVQPSHRPWGHCLASALPPPGRPFPLPRVQLQLAPTALAEEL